LAIVAFYIALIVWVALDSALVDTLIFTAILIVVGFIFLSPVAWSIWARQKFYDILRAHNKSIFDDDINDFFESEDYLKKS